MSATAEAPPAPIATASGDLIKRYIQLRDKLEEIRKAQTERNKPFVLAMDTIENELLRRIDAEKSKAINAEAGTAYKSLDTKAKVSAWSATLDWIRETETWEMLEARVAKTVVMAVIAEQQAELAALDPADPAYPEVKAKVEKGVPGVVVTQEYVVNVRRATA